MSDEAILKMAELIQENRKLVQKNKRLKERQYTKIAKENIKYYYGDFSEHEQMFPMN